MPAVRLLHDGSEHPDISEAELRSLESQGFGWEPLEDQPDKAGRPGATRKPSGDGTKEGE